MSKYAYFPGCSLHSTAREYEFSTKNLSRELGVELVDVPDWNCCGASSAHATDRGLDLALNGRNLDLAAGMGLDLAVPCASCYRRLASSRKSLTENPELRQQITTLLGQPLALSSEVRSLLEVFTTDEALDKMQRGAKKSLSGLKVAAYYGCLLVRPHKETHFDDSENPVSLDKLVTLMGGEALPWPFKTECCGGSLSFTAEDSSRVLIERILNMAKESGAECIITACPLCQSNLDMRQLQLAKEAGRDYNMPVLYFTQLMGLVLGLGEKALGLYRHFIDPRPVLQKVGLV